MAGSFKAELKPADLARLCVLIVDDSEHMRVLLRRLLSKLGVNRIHEYADASEALDEISARKPNLIFSDLSMERMNGIEFTRSVRRRASESECSIPIVMVTGHTERSHIEEARDAGVSEILAKPSNWRATLLQNHMSCAPRRVLRGYSTDRGVASRHA